MEKRENIHDFIKMQLKANTTIQAESSIITINVNTLIAEDKNYNLIIAEKLKSLDTVTSWILTDTSKRQNNGYEQIHMTYTSRMNDSQSLGLVDKLKKLDEKGMNFTLVGIQAKPTNTQFENAYKELRKMIYAKAAEELEAVSLVDREYHDGIIIAQPKNARWRINSIDFNTQLNSMISAANGIGIGARAATTYAKSVENADEEISNLSTKLEIEADVVFSRWFNA